jgi:hypothetical protein
MKSSRLGVEEFICGLLAGLIAGVFASFVFVWWLFN